MSAAMDVPSDMAKAGHRQKTYRGTTSKEQSEDSKNKRSDKRAPEDVAGPSERAKIAPMGVKTSV